MIQAGGILYFVMSKKIWSVGYIELVNSTLSCNV